MFLSITISTMIWFGLVKFLSFFLSQNSVLCFEKAKGHNLTKQNLIQRRDISTVFLAFSEHKPTISLEMAFLNFNFFKRITVHIPIFLLISLFPF